jgi:hypothetical protein
VCQVGSGDPSWAATSRGSHALKNLITNRYHTEHRTSSPRSSTPTSPRGLVVDSNSGPVIERMPVAELHEILDAAFTAS